MQPTDILPIIKIILKIILPIVSIMGGTLLILKGSGILR